MADETLPAEQPSMLPALNVDGLPDAPRYAAESVTEVLPPVAYQGIGSLANTLTVEQEAVLDEALPDEEVDIRPDGLVYASHNYYRRKLNKVFGRFGWTLIPGSPLKPRADKSDAKQSEWYQRWVLFVTGVYVAEAIASRTLYEDNRQMSLDDVAEAIKSDALKRCCKDLGIAWECWDKRWAETWKRKHAVKVACRVWSRGQQMTRELWRRKDADPLEGELSSESKKAVGAAAEKAAKTPPQQPLPSEASAAAQPEPESAPRPAPAGAARGATINQGQVKLVLARGRAAGLISGNDPALLMDVLGRAGLALVEQEGKSAIDNCIATIGQIGMRELAAILKQIDAAKDKGEERI